MNSRVRFLNLEEENYIKLQKVETFTDNNILLKINSNYNLMRIFSYLNYDKILKLIKNNKLLQNKIGIEKNNYKDYSNTEINSRKVKKTIMSGEININEIFITNSNCNINNDYFLCHIFIYIYIFFYFLLYLL